jgi:hypothetical protein
MAPLLHAQRVYCMCSSFMQPQPAEKSGEGWTSTQARADGATMAGPLRLRTVARNLAIGVPVHTNSPSIDDELMS